MRFNSGERMLPTEEAIYRRLGGSERRDFLEYGTSAVRLTDAEVSALEAEYEEECEWMYEQERRQMLAEFLCG